MIKINTIHIEEFRGIRSIDLNLNGKNFGICGLNGTGKSGVVDAIEFCLTGSVTRLTGQGQGELNVKSHSPHVDQRDTPEKAQVSITAFIPSIGKEVTITRSVDNPSIVNISPTGDKASAIIKELQSHPEFALSRREIAKYIVTPPSRRSADVQNLLRLDHIDSLRKIFVRYANKCNKDFNEADREFDTAEHQLKTALDLEELDRQKLIEKVNEQRGILGLPALSELSSKTFFMAGVPDSNDTDKKPTITKDMAVADLSAIAKAIEVGEPEESKLRRSDALDALKKLKEDSAALILARQHGFIKTGFDLITEDACPLCDKPWDAEELRQHLEAKLLSAKEMGSLLNKLGNDLGALLGSIQSQVTQVKKVGGYASILDPPISKKALDDHITVLQGARKAISDFQDDHSQINAVITMLSGEWWAIPVEAQSCINKVQMSVTALPDGSAREKATGFLSELQVRFGRLITATQATKKMSARNKAAQKVRDHYNDVSNSVLEGIYDAVAQDFTKYYKFINDDEQQFIGELKAEPAKLSFNVDFYGRGIFPPGAYHSEGHQDSMGLCLYLALMKHTLGDQFTFAVLDDVMMSVDTGHRREVCRLLKKEFPDTQFILTTHDQIWLKYLDTEGLIKNSQIFGGWNIETGPRIWEDTDVWTDIETALVKNDVPHAAALLRRYLEYISTVLADSLRARVEFRGDANYDLGDLLQPVLNQWKDRLKKGIKAAGTWGQDGAKAELESKTAEAVALINEIHTEWWAINKSVHFNKWGNFTPYEFRDVAGAFKAVLDHIRCSEPNCGSFPYLTPKKGSSEALRCACGTTNINLKTKKPD